MEDRILKLEQQVAVHDEKFRSGNERFNRNDELLNKLLVSTNENTHAIADVAKSLADLTNNTAALVQLQKEITGAAAFGKRVKSFLIWVASLGTAGAIVSTLLTKMIDKLPPCC